MKNPINVAITGMNSQPENPGPGLAVARSLRESNRFHGKIIGLSYDAFDPGLYLDQYSSSNYLLPYPFTGENAFLSRMEEIHAVEGIDVLIPCLDAELPNIVQLSATLQNMGISTLLPTPKQLQTRSKDRLSDIALLAGIACPEIKLISGSSFFMDCEKHGWTYPLVIKGAMYDAYVVANPAEGIRAFHKISTTWGFPVLVQKFVVGEEFNLAAVGDGQGNMLHAVMMKKLAITEKGKSWAGVSINNKTLQQLGQRLFQALRWRGPIEIEVIRDKQGVFHLIEVNPRFPAWIYLSVGVGRNLPQLLLDLVMHRPVHKPDELVTGMMIMRYAADVIKPISEFEKIAVLGQS